MGSDRMREKGHMQFFCWCQLLWRDAVDGQGQHGQEPFDQQTVGMMMTDMLEAVTTLGFVEALVLDLPAALGHAE